MKHSIDALLQIIARELDVPVEELQDEDAEFLELGVDQILAQTITTRIFQITGLKLPDDIFENFPKVGCFVKHVANISRPQTKKIKILSVLIQGNRAKNTKNVFLLPDGSGSAMAYASLPAVSPEVCIYAMNSPFLQEANGYTCSIEHLASIWAQEIERIQPLGPYILGGWSAGGYYSYEVMKLFHRQGKVVEKFIIIDSPCRTDFEAMPTQVLRHLASNNLMGNWRKGAGTPEWLINHFEATLRAVAEYKPSKITSSIKAPDVFVIWASDALLSQDAAAQTGLDLRLKVTRFLLAGRTDFGPCGWEKLLPGARMVVAKVPGHHFGVIHPPNVAVLGSLLSDVMQREAGDWRNEWKEVANT